MSGLAPGQIVLWAIICATLMVCLLAWLRGGFAERWGAVMVVATWALSTLIEGVFNHNAASVALIALPILTLDFLLSCGLLFLALRFGSLWIGAAMIAQSVQLGLHAFYLEEDGRNALLFAVGSNICSEVLILMLFLGTLTSWRRRLADRRAVAEVLPA